MSAQQPEHEQQVALLQWSRAVAYQCPELELLYAIPNGGKRARFEARRLHDEGVKAGVPDLCLPVARRGFHGLYIENKVIYTSGRRNTLSEQQKYWAHRLTAEGYQVVVCYTWLEGARAIADYLQAPELLEGIE